MFTQRIQILLLAGIGIFPLMASEYRGTIQAGGLPLPGATVTASQGGKKVIATTDERGVFRFADLADGTWTITVDMVGFQALTRDVGVAAMAPVPTWEMKFLSAKTAPAADATSPANRFQRLAVNQAAETTGATSEGALKSEEIADLTQNTANSFIVQGSMSSALGMGPQNDWGPRMAMGMSMEPGGGPGMMGAGQAGGPGGEAAGGTPPMQRGMGGPGGGPGGGGPPMGGGPGRGAMGFGGPGGPRGGGGGPPRGGPEWQGRPERHGFRQQSPRPAQQLHVQRQFRPEQLRSRRPHLFRHRRQPGQAGLRHRPGRFHVRRPAADSQTDQRGQAHPVHLEL